MQPSFQAFSKSFLFLFLIFVNLYSIFAQESYISTTEVTNGFTLSSGDKISTLFLDENDHEGVHWVAEDLKEDLKKITGKSPEISSEKINNEYPVIIGTLGKSKLIDDKELQIINMHEDTDDDWGTSVGNNTTRVISELNLENSANHSLKIFQIPRKYTKN